MSDSPPPIIIKKKRAAAQADHGGAWKVAFADFTTAMMAFFLLMWLIGNTSEAEKQAIAGYFEQPGGSIVGPGGANTGVIDLGKPQVQPGPTITPAADRPPSGTVVATADATALSDEALQQAQAERERELLDQLKAALEKELARNASVFSELRDQILIDYTQLGLRIQIVDKANRPMFDLGSSRLKSYSTEVLRALAPLLDSVPNPITITGHTDAVPFGASSFYTNWELSSDRANTARRALLDGGYPVGKLLTVQGMASASPFKPDAPNDPMNRRIAILVVKQSVADAMLGHTGLASDELIRSEGAVLRALGEALPTAIAAP